MGISNLTSSIRGVSGTEKITNINKIETTTIVAANASIAGIDVGATLDITHIKTITASLNEAKVVLVASTGGTQVAYTINASRNGTLTNSGGITGQETYVEASIVNSGKSMGMTALYGNSKNKGGTLLWNNAGFTYAYNKGGTSNYAYGHEAWVEVDGGTIGTGYGFHTYVARTSGTFSNAIGFSADIDGVIGNAYGLKVDLEDVTGNIWGIYSSGESINYLSGNLQVEGGVVTVGSVDAVTGALVLFGNGDQTGGRITLHSGANLDATINSYSVLVGQDDFRIGPAANASALMYRGLDNWWVLNAPTTVASGTLDVGILYTKSGMITLHGTDTGNQGGKIRLYNASSFAPVQSQFWYDISVVGSNLQIGHGVAQDSLEYYGDGAMWRFREGAVGMGKTGNTRGILDLYGDSDDTGGEIRLHAGNSFISDVTLFKFTIDEGSLHLRHDGGDANQIWEYEAQNRNWDIYVKNVIDIQNASAVIIGGAGYLNMNSTAGRIGYGIRDNVGVMQFKNSAGTWANIT